MIKKLINSIIDLRDFLNEIAECPGTPEGVDTYEFHGVDLAALPTFGGEEPSDTEGIFSWDEEYFLVQGAGGRWELVPRDELEAGE